MRLCAALLLMSAVCVSLPQAQAEGDAPTLKVDIKYYPAHSFQTTLAFSANSRWLAAGLSDGSAQVFDVRHRRWALHTPKLSPGGVETIAISPNGALLAMAGNRDGVLIVNAHSGRVLKTLKFGIPDGMGVLCVAFSPDGKLLAASDAGPETGEALVDAKGEVRVWSATDWTLQKRFQASPFPRSVEFSADGRLLAEGGDSARLTDWRTGKAMIKFDDPSRYPVSISPDGRMLATSSGLYDLKSRAVHGHLSGQYNCLAFNRSGTILLAGSQEDGIGIWDGHTGVQIADLDLYTDVLALSPDGKTIAGGSEDGLEIVNIDERSLRKRLTRLSKKRH